MSEPLPLLDGESPWPVPTGTLGRSAVTPVVGPGSSEPAVAWTYDHDVELVAPPVVTRDGEIVLLDDGGRLTLVSPEGLAGWSVALDVAPDEASNSPAVWRRDGRTLVSVSHDGGVLLVDPGDGVVEDVPIEPPGRFLCLREDGLVTWSREAVSLLDERGDVIDEHLFVWRSDDVACPTVGPDGAVYVLENREYAPSWDAEDQSLEVAKVTFDGGAARESIVAAHAFTTDAVGSLCATGERLVWLLDSVRLGYSSSRGEVEEMALEERSGGTFPSRILGGSGDTVLLQREAAGLTVYSLTDETLSTWAVDEPVESVVLDAEGTAYLLAGGSLHAADLDGATRVTIPANGGWLAAASGTLFLSDAAGTVTALRSPS